LPSGKVFISSPINSECLALESLRVSTKPDGDCPPCFLISFKSSGIFKKYFSPLEKASIAGWLLPFFARLIAIATLLSEYKR